MRFDYKTDATGVEVRRGAEYKLAQDWLIDSSPTNDLDYALLRVDGKPGAEAAGGRTGSPVRGWLTPHPQNVVPNQPLFVYQHPQGRPLQVALDRVLSVDGKLVRYSTNTEAGSSGSPAFNSELDLVALHHGGQNSRIPQYNEGILFNAILQKPRVTAALGT
jgi:hypothetical protein